MRWYQCILNIFLLFILIIWSSLSTPPIYLLYASTVDGRGRVFLPSLLCLVFLAQVHEQRTCSRPFFGLSMMLLQCHCSNATRAPCSILLVSCGVFTMSVGNP